MSGGPAAAASLYRSAVAVLHRSSSVSFTVDGLIAMRSIQGSTSTFSWYWANGTSVRGYAPAIDHVTEALQGGRVVWTLENLEPAVPFTTAGIDPRVPFEVLDSTGGAYGRFVDGVVVTSSTCAFRLASGSTPFPLGSSIDSPAGYTFLSVRRAGGLAVVTFRYRYDYVIVTESDTISIATDHFVAQVVHKPASPAHHLGAASWRITQWHYVSAPPGPATRPPVWAHCRG